MKAESYIWPNPIIKMLIATKTSHSRLLKILFVLIYFWGPLTGASLARAENVTSVDLLISGVLTYCLPTVVSGHSIKDLPASVLQENFLSVPQTYTELFLDNGPGHVFKFNHPRHEVFLIEHSDANGHPKNCIVFVGEADPVAFREKIKSWFESDASPLNSIPAPSKMTDDKITQLYCGPVGQRYILINAISMNEKIHKDRSEGVVLVYGVPNCPKGP